MSTKYPQFISSKPIGKDEFLGKSQEKVADVISQTIKSSPIGKRIIGLEGEWGSGKSNVVMMIEQNINKTHHTFIFDAWGSQEDLTRRSFLEQLISELFDKKVLTDKEKWRKLQNGLLSKSSTTIKQTFPSVRFYWFVISFAILLTGFLDNLYNNVFVTENLFPNRDFGILKPAIFIYLVPSMVFIWGIYLFIREYKKKERKVQKETNLNKTVN